MTRFTYIGVGDGKLKEDKNGIFICLDEGEMILSADEVKELSYVLAHEYISKDYPKAKQAIDKMFLTLRQAKENASR